MKSAEETKAFVLEAFDLLFNQRDYATAARFWSENYIQHSAHIPPGRDGLFNLVRNAPSTLRTRMRGSWWTATGSCYTDASADTAALAHGLPQISCEWKAVSWRSIGMYCRTKPQSLSRRAACRCSVLRSQKQISVGRDRGTVRRIFG